MRMGAERREAASLDWLLPPGASGDHPVLVLRLPVGRAARAAAWTLMPLRMRIASRRMSRAGARAITRLACYPDADSPTLVYEIPSAAARYAERHLLPAGPTGSLANLVRSVLAAWSGCDPAVGAIVVMGSPS